MHLKNMDLRMRGRAHYLKKWSMLSYEISTSLNEIDGHPMKYKSFILLLVKSMHIKNKFKSDINH